MSYVYRALFDHPLALWPLTQASGSSFEDVSGNNKTATFSGSIIADAPIVAAGEAGQYMNSGSVITLPIDSLFIAGRESKSFSLEAWIKPRGDVGYARLFSRNSDGLLVQGHSIIFRTTMSNTLTVSYDEMKVGEVYHVVVTYDGIGINLYVNGKLWDSASVTPEDYAAGFQSGGNTTLTVSANGGLDISIDSLAVYNYAATRSLVTAHYAMGTRYLDTLAVSSKNGAVAFDISDQSADIYRRFDFRTEEDWNRGKFSDNITLQDDLEVDPYLSTSTNGVWTVAVPIEPDAFTIPSSHLTWDSVEASVGNLTIETSLDGDTWTVATNGSSPFNNIDCTNGVSLFIRATLSWSSKTALRSLTLALYRTKSLISTDSDIKASIISGVIPDEHIEPSSFNDNGAMSLSTGATINSDDAYGAFQGIEMTMRVDQSIANATVFANDTASVTTDASGNWTTTGATVYVDGQQITAPYSIPTEVWHHVFIVFPASSASINLGNSDGAGAGAYSMYVGAIHLYNYALSSSDVRLVYDAWTGTTPVRIQDASGVSVAEHALENGNAFRVYTYAWSITSGG